MNIPALPCHERIISMSQDPGPSISPTSQPGFPAWGYLFVGVGAVCFGLLPWLVTGMRLPLQNLWAVQALPEHMPRTLLPFSQYEVTSMLAMIVMGMGLAGFSVRAMPSGLRPKAASYTGIGAFAACGFATIQTSVVVREGLRLSLASTTYFLAVLAVIVVGVVVGLLVLLLIARGKPLTVSIGATLAAVALGIWMRTLMVAVSSDAASQMVPAVVGATRWLPALLVGAALAWCGIGTIRQGVAWAVNLLLLWAIPAALEGLSYAAGSRILAGDMEEMARSGIDLFLNALGPAGGAIGPVVVALVVAVSGLFAVRARNAGKTTAS